MNISIQQNNLEAILHEWNCSKKKIVQTAQKKLEEFEGQKCIDLEKLRNFLEKIRVIYSNFKNEKNSEISRLKLSYLRCQYRFKLVKTEEAVSSIKDQLAEAVLQFKKEEVNCFDKMLTDSDLKEIEVLARYKKIARFLIKNQNLQKNFFKSCLRDNISVKILCSYNLERLFPYKMHYHLGAFHSKKMIKSIDSLEGNYLGILCEGQYVNTFDFDQTIVFSDQYRMTWKQVLKEFSKADERAIELTFFDNGLHHWNSIMRGPEINDPNRYLKRLKQNKLQKCCRRIAKFFRPPVRAYGTIDLSQDRFWEKLPQFAVLTEKQLKDLYGINLKTTDEFLKIIEAARSNPALDALNSHSYMVLCQRIDQERFKIYPFGIFSKSWPRNLISKLSFLGGTYEGTIAFPDPNMFTPFRQKASHVVQNEKGTFEETCKKMAQLEKEGIAFQYLWENCTTLIEKTTENFSTENFTCHFKEIYLKGPLSYIQKIWKRLKGRLRKYYENFLHFLCRSKRRYLNKCVHETPFKNNLQVRVPAKLHELILNNYIEGQIRYGHPKNKETIKET